jgi:hypothetical protein
MIPYCFLKSHLNAILPLRSTEAHLGDRRYSSYSSLTSAVEGGEWSASRPGRALPPGETAPGTPWTGGWVGPRASLDAEVRGKILCLCRGSNPGRPVRSQTLHWLSYPGSYVFLVVSSIQAFQPNFYMHFWPPPCAFHARPISPPLNWSFQ